METSFGLSGFHGENKIDPVVGGFYFHHNSDGGDLPVLMVNIKLAPDMFDFTLWFSYNMVKIKEIFNRSIIEAIGNFIKVQE